MALTPAQKACVERLDGPLVVSAGAGSGKTFTLTHRIAHAFDVGYISDMDEVMAITYTTKAAEELKSRVKGVLRAEGRIDQALKVDGAWISTIHGACSRILKEHALALGISPDFEVADEGRSERLLDESIEEVLSSYSDLVTPEDSSGGNLDLLFREYRPRSAGWDESSIEAMLRKLVTTASEDPCGMEVFVHPPKARSPEDIAYDFLGLAKETSAVAGGANQSKTRDAFIEGTADAAAALEEVLGVDGVDVQNIIRLLNAFPKPSRGFGGKDVKDAMGEALEDYKALAMEARMAAAEPRLDELFDLAERTLGAYTARKREAGLLDYGDLVALSLRALDEHPDIAQSYVERFKLVMVDEFQDTDQVQVDLVGRLTGRDFGRLCTVGDEQQSIYRFRGADVSVYRRHLERVREASPDGVIELSDNFRSHPDILGFVERVFCREEAFGDSFLALSAARDEGRVARPFRGEGPRVQILLTTTTYGGGVGIDAAAREAARRIAERFAEFRDAGQDPGDMVLLLGGMRRADVYAEELRRAGLPCVVTGGSIFSGSAEAKLVLRLAQVAADPHDQAALFEVLSSELFALSADDLLRLSTGEDPEHGIPCRRSIDRGFQDLLGQLEAGVELPEALSCALRALDKLARGAGKVPSSKLVEGVLLDSGWLSRMEALGPEGTARAANAYKAIRIMEDIEASESAGPARVARGLAERLNILRTSPGSLSAEAGGFVRIMTIHASKGLEFPIVAVAELRSSGSPSAKLLSSKVGDKVYLSLDAGESASRACEDDSSIMKAASSYQPYEDFPDESTAEEVRTSASPADRRAAIKHREKEEGAAEDQRLLYVALTRAKEALVISLLGSSSKTHPSGLSSGSGKLIEEALCPAGEAFCTSPEEREGVQQYDFGGEQPARVEHLHLPSEEEKSKEEAEAAEAGEAAEEEAVAQEPLAPAEPAEPQPPFQLMEVQPLAEAQDGTLPSPRRGVFSYSAISPHEAAAPAPQPVPADVDDEADDDEAPRFADADRATDLGTAFHRLAQLSVEAKEEGGALLRPSAERQEALCRACGVSDAQRIRLDAALGRWFGSELCAEAAGWPQTAAEVPFFLQVRGPEDEAAADAAGEEAPCMEGEIDLLCSDPAASRALVIDYKTGGSPDETPEQLHEKHLLQARCYAYAVLSQGAGEVEARFVRVEREDPARPGQPQVVGYSFTADELDDLGGLILEQYRASQGA